MVNIFFVFCIGAALVDMVAQVERHPSDDDEVFVSNLNLFSGGAAANTAYACGKMGLSATFIGKLGKNDIFGNKIISDFKEASVETRLIKYSDRYKTGSAYVALNEKGERRIYAYSGAANYLSKNDLLEEEIGATKIIFLSSLQNLEPLLHAAKIGRNLNIPVILNPGMLIIEQGFGYIKNLLEKIDILILSQKEFKTLFNFKEKDLSQDSIRERAVSLFALGMKIIVITLGEKGAFILTTKHYELIQPLKLEKVIDTTGAGDAFSAGFIYGLVKNLNLKFEHLRNNVKIGNFVAGNCIQKLGARNGFPMRNELKTYLSNINKKI
ncbi:MAG: carbohydrate kinase family protein [Promethearchaeota archaeon]